MRELDLVQRNGERLQIEYKDIKDLEAIEKKDFPATKQVRIHSYSLQIEVSQGQIIFLDLSNAKRSFVKGFGLQVYVYRFSGCGHDFCCHCWC